jgi:L-amino acid N-acyltransferase YncA
LIVCSEENGYWTLQAGIFPENTSSLKLHQKCGFTVVGRGRKIGQMNGQWRDVLLLVKRCEVVEKE